MKHTHKYPNPYEMHKTENFHLSPILKVFMNASGDKLGVDSGSSS